MHRRKLSALIMLATTFNFSAQTIDVFASEIKEDIKLSRSISNEENGNIQLNQSKVSKFDLLNSSYLEEYNKAFKLDNSKIISITNNGGQYSSSNISKAIDGNFSTHWETGKVNSETFENEVILTLEEVTKLNRIHIGTRIGERT